MVAVHLQDDLRRVLDEEGRVIKGAKVPPVPDEDLMRIFECMLLIRVMDDRMMKIQRQGRLGFYMQAIGEEASSLRGLSAAQERLDLPQLPRAGGAVLGRLQVENFIDQLFGNEKRPGQGPPDAGAPLRELAQRTCRSARRSAPRSPQAVGTAMAMKASEAPTAWRWPSSARGTSSTGDFHVGLNLAGVHKAPVVFVCRNNGYAISVPIAKQTAAKTFASKAVGYGMPGVRVDGNDILAVLQVAPRRSSARAPETGPTLIEALTYRREGHSSSDDPSVYRDASEPEVWHKKDPVNRLRGYMRQRGLWSEQQEARSSRGTTSDHRGAGAGRAPRRCRRSSRCSTTSSRSCPGTCASQRDWLLSCRG